MSNIDTAVEENLRYLNGACGLSWDQIAAEHAHDEDIVAFCAEQGGEVPVAPAAPPVKDPAPDGAPSKSASKVAWVEYAVSKGVDQAEAEGLTRDQLVERFTAEA